MENICQKFTAESNRIETTMRDIFTYDFIRNGVNFVEVRAKTKWPIDAQVIVNHMWLVKDDVEDRVRDRKYNNIQ